MSLSFGRDPASTEPAWLEWHLQAYCIQEARRAGYIVHGDQNGAHKSRTSASMAKATGTLAGWPDTCFVVSGAPIWIELKFADGAQSKVQRDLHPHFAAMGYAVHTVYAESLANAWAQGRVLLPDISRAQKAEAAEWSAFFAIPPTTTRPLPSG